MHGAVTIPDEPDFEAFFPSENTPTEGVIPKLDRFAVPTADLFDACPPERGAQ